MKTIRLITPSWLIKDVKDFQKGIRLIENLGFNITNRKVLKTLPSPQKKAVEIQEAFLDKKTDIILAQRGGYSSLKVLQYMNLDIIKKNPKIFAGFSDLSTFLNYFYEKCGLVTLHAPMVINLSKPTRFTVKSFLNALNGFPDKELFRSAPVKVYKHGKAMGVLKGGNLVTITSLLGTHWEIETKGAVVFLEDVDEELHRIDRYLTQWILMGKLNGIKGLILGDFRGVKSEDVFKILSSQMKINFPVVHCPYIGHVKNKITLPVGAKVRLATKNKSMVIL